MAQQKQSPNDCKMVVYSPADSNGKRIRTLIYRSYWENDVEETDADGKVLRTVKSFKSRGFTLPPEESDPEGWTTNQLADIKVG